MRLDRFVHPQGRGKYALLNLRRNTVEWGDTEENAFFVIKLKDRAAEAALRAYARRIEELAEEMTGHQQQEYIEYAMDMHQLADDAAVNPAQKLPD